MFERIGDSVLIWERSLVHGASWLGIGMTLVILALLAISGWELYQATRLFEPLAVVASREELLVVDGDLPAAGHRVTQAEFVLRQRLDEGLIDRATYDRELAELHRQQAA